MHLCVPLVAGQEKGDDTDARRGCTSDHLGLNRPTELFPGRCGGNEDRCLACRPRIGLGGKCEYGLLKRRQAGRTDEAEAAGRCQRQPPSV